MDERESTKAEGGRDASGRWVKGFTPNPGGEHKMVKEVRKALEAGLPGAAERLIELCASKDERVAVVAIRDLMDRCMGKPKQSVDLGDEIPHALLALLELAAKKRAT